VSASGGEAAKRTADELGDVSAEAHADVALQLDAGVLVQMG
jgi:hypothetical protein